MNGHILKSNQADATIRKCQCFVTPGGIAQFHPHDGLGEIALNNTVDKKIFLTKVSGRNGVVTLFETTAADVIADTEIAKLTLEVGIWDELTPNPQSWIDIANNRHATFKANDNNPSNMYIEGWVFLDGPFP